MFGAQHAAAVGEKLLCFGGGTGRVAALAPPKSQEIASCQACRDDPRSARAMAEMRKGMFGSIVVGSVGRPLGSTSAGANPLAGNHVKMLDPPPSP